MTAGTDDLADGWRLAVGTLTALPVRPPDRVDQTVAAAAMLLAPVVGVLVGALCGLASWGCLALGLDPSAAALAAVAIGAGVTRGLHLDGLADTADGLGSGFDRERALTVMRRGDVGPVGVVSLVLVLIGQVVLGAQVVAEVGGWAVSAAWAASRSVLPVLCVPGWGSARPGGLGATVLGAVPVRAAVLAVGLSTLAALGAGGLAGAGVLGVYAVPAAVLGGLAVAGQSRRRLGGLTGDVLGAAVEVGVLVALAGLAIAA